MMSARKYNTLNNVLYIIDRRGKVYINEFGKVKRSKTEYHYELMLNTGGNWFSTDRYSTRSEAMDRVRQLGK